MPQKMLDFGGIAHTRVLYNLSRMEFEVTLTLEECPGVYERYVGRGRLYKEALDHAHALLGADVLDQAIDYVHPPEKEQ